MPEFGMQQLIDGSRFVRANTITIAEDIPEEKYHYRPTPGSRSAAETLVHIAWLASADRTIHEQEHLASFAGFDFAGLLKSSEVEERRERPKADIIELLRAEGEGWMRWVQSRSEEFLAEEFSLPDGARQTRFEMLLGTKEHEMSHQGQLMVLQRLVGVVPHFTRSLPVQRGVAG